MKKIVLGAITAGALFAALPGSALAARPASTPADGRCVATGVKTLGPEAIRAAATGQLPVSLSFVILDHAFNNANATEGLLGVTICE